MEWLNMVLVLHYLTILAHVVWFIIFGRYSFPNMPCGTTIFFFGPVEDVGMDVLAIYMGPGLLGAVVILTLLMCGSCFAFAGQVLESMMKSSTYQRLFPGVRYKPVVQLQSTSSRYHWVWKLHDWFADRREKLRNKYGPFLDTLSRPFHGQRRRCMPVSKDL